MVINGLRMQQGSIKELLVPKRSVVGQPDSPNDVTVDDTNTEGMSSLIMSTPVVPTLTLGRVQAYDGVNTDYNFRRESVSFDHPLEVDSHIVMRSSSGENFQYRLSDTSDSNGGYLDISEVEELDLTFDMLRESWASNYRVWTAVDGIFRVDWLRSGAYGSNYGNVRLYMLASGANQILLTDVTLFDWSTFRVVLNADGITISLDGQTLYTNGAYTMEAVKNYGIGVTSIRAHAGSNSLRLRNIDFKWS